jgi:hypothetical protein
MALPTAYETKGGKPGLFSWPGLLRKSVAQVADVFDGPAHLQVGVITLPLSVICWKANKLTCVDSGTVLLSYFKRTHCRCLRTIAQR